jgi:two-component system, LytTR family, sensor histidine kinase AlgZ
MNNACSDNSGSKDTSEIVEGFIKAAWVIPGVGILATVLLFVAEHFQLSLIGRKLVTCLVYSAMIGLPSTISLTSVTYRYSPRFPRLIVLFQSLLLLSTATLGCLAAGIAFQFSGMMPRSFYWIEFRSSFPFALVITLATGLSIASFETLRHKLESATLALRTQQVEQERAYKLLAEARLSSLESRIHPHFLFNTLNSIASLIPTDPQRAEDTVGKLASLLRFSLGANQTGLVPLAQELKIVRYYLEIEQTRFGSRLRFQIEAPSNPDGIQVPPLALQTLVENSIKHVVARRPEGATIVIRSTLEADNLRMEVIDDGPGFSLESIAPEHGLGNLIARLQLLFGERGQLLVTRPDENTIVTLLFPVKL